jgi:hypothetical protein
MRPSANFSKEADMLRQFSWTTFFFVILGFASLALGQAPAPENNYSADNLSAWHRASGSAPQSAAVPEVALRDRNSALPARTDVASVSAPFVESTKKAMVPISGDLPNDAGQVWREYDISAYTTRATATKRPEQALIDWILRETGYEAWHTETVSVLNADARTLRVYHTPEMQRVVADLVARFVSSEAASYTFSLRVVTLDSPDWRAAAQRLLRAVPVQTPGINAWVLAQEDAAMLLGLLRHRSDYREHSSPYLVVNNGQSTVVSQMRGRPYVRDVLLRPDTAAGFDPSPGQVDEGFALDFSSLLSADRRTIDARIKCDIDQVEKMIPVMIDVPTQNSRQRAKIEVPQITHYRFHERFRWPIDEVLLVGMGMVALPIPVDGTPLIQGISLPIGLTPARADLLLFVECKGQTTPTAATPNATQPVQPVHREAKNYRGRY